MQADDLIGALGLEPHPEGGFFKETFRSASSVASSAHSGPRSASTAIYFLLKQGQRSAFHRVASDEVWHLYAGDALELVTIDAQAACAVHLLGPDLQRGERPQVVVPAGVWQGARPRAPASGAAHGFSLCGCTVAPGFEFADFELPSRDVLMELFPQHEPWILALSEPR